MLRLRGRGTAAHSCAANAGARGHRWGVPVCSWSLSHVHPFSRRSYRCASLLLQGLQEKSLKKKVLKKKGCERPKLRPSPGDNNPESTRGPFPSEVCKQGLEAGSAPPPPLDHQRVVPVSVPVCGALKAPIRASRVWDPIRAPALAACQRQYRPVRQAKYAANCGISVSSVGIHRKASPCTWTCTAQSRR